MTPETEKALLALKGPDKLAKLQATLRALDTEVDPGRRQNLLDRLPILRGDAPAPRQPGEGLVQPPDLTYKKRDVLPSDLETRLSEIESRLTALESQDTGLLERVRVLELPQREE